MKNKSPGKLFHVAELIKQATDVLRSNNIDQPEREARLLLSHVLNIDYLQLITAQQKSISKGDKNKFLAIVKKRAHNLPFAYIANHREFFSLDFYVNRAVLIPRPTSEAICQTVMDNFPKGKNLHIADIGTGSGCLLITLLHHFKQATGVGIDISSRALQVAKHNAKKNNLADRVQFIKKDIKKYAKQKNISKPQYDVIISNPPYVAIDEYKKLNKNIFFEPRRALLAKNQGLFFYPFIKQFADQYLKPSGLLVLECAPRQKKFIEEIFTNSPYKISIIT